MRLALIVCRRHLNDYSCAKSKHTFTQPQLLSCLVLKAYKKLSYRGTTELLEASDGLRQALGLERAPAHTTLKEFLDRVMTPQMLDELVGQVLAMLQEERGLVVGELAVDSTGVEATCASAHFVSRSKRRRNGYVKLSLAVACGNIVLVSMATTFGPTNDLCEAREVLWHASGRCRPSFAFMDKGYDAEWVHRLCRDGQGTLSYLPPVPKTADGSVKTRHRSRCARYRPYNAGRRWHAESFISGMKRTCGSTLSSRTDRALLVEAGLKALAYAIRR